MSAAARAQVEEGLAEAVQLEADLRLMSQRLARMTEQLRALSLPSEGEAMVRRMPSPSPRKVSTDELLEQTRRAHLAVTVATQELARLTRALRESLEGDPWPQ